MPLELNITTLGQMAEKLDVQLDESSRPEGLLKKGSLEKTPSFVPPSTTKTDLENRMQSLGDKTPSRVSLAHGDIQRVKRGVTTEGETIINNEMESDDRLLIRYEGVKKREQEGFKPPESSLAGRIREQGGGESPRKFMDRFGDFVANNLDLDGQQLQALENKANGVLLGGMKARVRDGMVLERKPKKDEVVDPNVKQEILKKYNGKPSTDNLVPEEIVEFVESIRAELGDENAGLIEGWLENEYQAQTFGKFRAKELNKSQGTDFPFPFSITAPMDMPEVPSGFLASLKNLLRNFASAFGKDWSYAGQAREAFKNGIPGMQDQFRSWLKSELAELRSKNPNEAKSIKHALQFFSEEQVKDALAKMFEAARIPHPELHEELASSIYTAMVEEVADSTLISLTGTIAEKKEQAISNKVLEVGNNIEGIRTRAWFTAGNLAMSGEKASQGLAEMRGELNQLKKSLATPIKYDPSFPNETTSLPKDRVEFLTRQIEAMENELTQAELAHEALRDIVGYDGKQHEGPTLQSLDDRLKEAINKPFASETEQQEHFRALAEDLNKLKGKLLENRTKLSQNQWDKLSSQLEGYDSVLRQAVAFREHIDSGERLLRECKGSDEISSKEFELGVLQLQLKGRMLSSDPSDSFSLEDVVSKRCSNLGIRMEQVRNGLLARESLSESSFELADDVSDHPENFKKALELFNDKAFGKQMVIDIGEQACPGKFDDMPDRLATGRGRIARAYLGLPKTTSPIAVKHLGQWHAKGLLDEVFLKPLKTALNGDEKALENFLEEVNSGDLSRLSKAVDDVFAESDIALAFKLAMVPGERSEEVIRDHYVTRAGQSIDALLQSEEFGKALAIIGLKPETREDFIEALPQLANAYSEWFSSNDGLKTLINNLSQVGELLNPETASQLSLEKINELSALLETLRHSVPSESHLNKGRVALDQMSSLGVASTLMTKLGMDNTIDPSTEELRNQLSKISTEGIDQGELSKIEGSLQQIQEKLEVVERGSSLLRSELTGPLRELAPVFGVQGETEVMEKLQSPQFQPTAKHLTNVARLFLSVEELGTEGISEEEARMHEEALLNLSEELERFDPESLKEKGGPFLALKKMFLGAEAPQSVVDRLEKLGGKEKAQKFIQAWKHVVTLNALDRSKTQIQEQMHGILQQREEVLGELRSLQERQAVRLAIIEEFRNSGESFETFTLTETRLQNIKNRLESWGVSSSARTWLMNWANKEGGQLSKEQIERWADEGSGERSKVEQRLSEYTQALEEFGELLETLQKGLPNVPVEEIGQLRREDYKLPPPPSTKFGSTFPDLSSNQEVGSALQEKLKLNLSPERPTEEGIGVIRGVLVGVEHEAAKPVLQIADGVGKIMKQLQKLRKIKESAPWMKLDVGGVENQLNELKKLMFLAEDLKPGAFSNQPLLRSMIDSLGRDLPTFIGLVNNELQVLSN